MISFVLAVDSGTSATKIAVVDPDLCRVSASISVSHVKFNPSRFDPRSVWFAALRNGLQNLKEANPHCFGDIDAIAITGVMETLVVPDVGAILYSSETPANHWMTKAMNSTIPARMLALQHDEGVHPSKPILFGSADFLIKELTGVYLTDPTNCSTLGIMKTGTQHRVFDKELLTSIGLEKEWVSTLPTIQTDPTNSCDCMTLSHEASTKLDIVQLAGVPVVHGGGDAATVAIGAGQSLYSPRRHIYFGTTTWIGQTLASSRESPDRKELFRLAHPVPGYVFDLASSLSGGSVFSWGCSTLLGSQGGTFESLDDLASQSARDDVLFLPYINGERCPFIERSPRGAFLGISASTTQADLVRATLLGVCFNLRLLMELTESVSAKEEALHLTGGGAQSSVFGQLLADILDRQIEVSVDGCPGPFVGRLGAALIAENSLGGVSLGKRPHITPSRVFQPQRSFDFEKWREACERHIGVSLKP